MGFVVSFQNFGGVYDGYGGGPGDADCYAVLGDAGCVAFPYDADGAAAGSLKEVNFGSPSVALN